jgi:TadE-like protein
MRSLLKPIRILESGGKIALRDESGAEMAELAFVMPLLFMLLFGIMWFGRAFQIYSTVNQAARAAAEAAALPSCPAASCGNTFPNSNAAYIQTNVVNPILVAAHLDPTQVQAFSLQTNQVLNPSSTPQEIGTIVSFTYPYSFKLNGISCCPLAMVPITNGITLTARAQAREEQ